MLTISRLESGRKQVRKITTAQPGAVKAKTCAVGGPREAPCGKVLIEIYLMLDNIDSGLAIGFPRGCWPNSRREDLLSVLRPALGRPEILILKPFRF